MVTSKPSLMSRKAFWLMLALNVFLSLALTVSHAIQSKVFLNWRVLLAFEGEHPFQSRVLPFLLTNAVAHFRPLGDQGLSLLFMLMDLVGILACFWFTWKSWEALTKNGGRALLMFGLFWWQLFATFVLSAYNNYYYPWDMMSLGFIAAGMWMIVSRQPLPALLALAVPAMMNRETFIVIPFFYLAYNWPASKPTWRQFGAILLVCLAVKTTISACLDVSTDMVSLYHMPGFPRIYYNFAFLWLGPDYRHTLNVFFAFGFAWLLLLMPGQSDKRLRNMMLCFIPFLLGMMFVGNLSEIRIFAEFIPLMSLMLAGKLSSADEDQALTPGDQQ